MGRYPALWKVDGNKIPIDPKERGNIRRIKGALYRPETDFSHNMRINLINVIRTEWPRALVGGEP